MKSGATEAGRIKQAVRAAIASSAASLVELADALHEHPEVAFEEHASARRVAASLERGGGAGARGYEVEIGAYGLDTAFAASAGAGPLEVALCAEYDALPDIGHACGHNLIAAAAVGAALALRPFAGDLGVRLRVLGTPAEEVGDGGGKILMLERGAFGDTHLAMMVHPGPFDDLTPAEIAISAFKVEYHGKEVHATFHSHLGVNAGAAANIAQVALNEMRQQLTARQRVHGIVEKFGSAANTLSGYSRLSYMIRSDSLEDLEQLRALVLRCFEAGAVATGARMEVIGGTKPYAPLLSDLSAANAFGANVEAAGERRFPNPGEGPPTSAGTDFGNVSQRVPSIQPMLGLGCYPVVNHQAEFAAKCRGERAEAALLDGALGMAGAVVDLACDDAERRRLLARPSPAAAGPATG